MLDRTLTAARLVGLKLALLAVSFAAVAAGVAQDTQSIAELNFGGMKLMHLLVGTFFAGLSLWFVPQLTGRVLGATISCGLGFATVGTSLFLFVIEHVLNWGRVPAPVENMIAAVLGVLGVFIIPGLRELGRQWGEDPRGFIAWLRNRNSQPPTGGQQ